MKHTDESQNIPPSLPPSVESCELSILLFKLDCKKINVALLKYENIYKTSNNLPRFKKKKI